MTAANSASIALLSVAIGTALGVGVGVGVGISTDILVDVLRDEDELQVEDDEELHVEVLLVVGSGVHVVVGGGGGVQVVVGSGFHVVVGSGFHVVVGSGFHVVVGAGGGSPEPKTQEPVMTPSSSDAKYWKRPGEKSRPPYGHPGHSSTICACVDLPLAVIVIILKQSPPLPYC